MNAADVMTYPVVTITPDASIEEVARLMACDRISGLPVMDAAGKLVGIITEGDLLRRAEIGTERSHSRLAEFLMSPGRLARDYVRAHGRKVREIMTERVVSVSPDTPLAEIVALMEARRIKRIPVIRDEKLIGIVSRADLLHALTTLLPGPSRAASDAALRARIIAEIDKQPWAPRTSLDVIVENGEVTLRGVIFDERQREALRVMAENTAGVTRVTDRLAWVDPFCGSVIEGSREQEGSDSTKSVDTSRRLGASVAAQ